MNLSVKGITSFAGAVRAILFRAMAIQNQGMLIEFEIKLSHHFPLSLFDGLIVEFFDPTAFQTDDMIVVIAMIQFEDGLPSFEVMALNQTRRFELSKDPVNGSQTDFLAGI